MASLSRRTFSKNLTKAVIGSSLVSPIPLACAFAKANKNKLGVALVGLGSYSTYQLAPALQDTKYCSLTAIVTGTPSKEQAWMQRYNIPSRNVYNYDTFDSIVDNDEIDIVYVVLPNALHADFCIRAAGAGKHVICEKPMAISVSECQAIIDACAAANVKLGVGYRLQSEPYTQQIKEFVATEKFGKINYVTAEAGYYSGGNPDQWRLNKALSGGGALMNMGVYAIQGLIYGSGELPLSVKAQEYVTRPAYFKDTDETITAQFEFPNGIVGTMMTSHNGRGDRLYAACDQGWFELDTAFSYGPLHGRTSQNEITFPHQSQQRLQMDDFALHILKNAENKAPGSMGLRDMKIIEAIYGSISQQGEKVILNL